MMRSHPFVIFDGIIVLLLIVAIALILGVLTGRVRAEPLSRSFYNEKGRYQDRRAPAVIRRPTPTIVVNRPAGPCNVVGRQCSTTTRVKSSGLHGIDDEDQ